MTAIVCAKTAHNVWQHFDDRNLFAIFCCQEMGSFTAYGSATDHDYSFGCTSQFWLAKQIDSLYNIWLVDAGQFGGNRIATYSNNDGIKFAFEIFRSYRMV